MSRKLSIAAITAGIVLAVMAVAALPTASADQCTVTVTLASGQVLSYTVDAAPGTPASSLVPAGAGPIKAASESCAPPPTQQSSGSSSHSGSSGSSSPTPAPKTSGPGNGQAPPQHNSKPSTPAPGSQGHPALPPPPKVSKPAPSAPTVAPPPAARLVPPSTGAGVPTPENPTFSFATPGPAQIGVPDFFIDAFDVPPFLMPMYQAAGIEYDVPWQVLAAINEIETDYGRNLSVSTAGAEGWMQFMPQTWKQYAVDANGDGVADPYNPADAIFTAAKYLHSAGASKNLSGAIFSYNHADWYVQSVLLRAKLLGGMPDKLVGALTGLVEGDFPVAAQARYADGGITHLASFKRTKPGANPSITINSDKSTSTNIFAKQNSPVIAVNDGKVVKIGQSPQLGKFLQLQDANGNIYTYADLGSIPSQYPVPKPEPITAAQITKELSLPAGPPPKQAATAGSQKAPATISTAKATKEAKAVPPSLPVTPVASDQSASIPAPMVKERLFADPYRPASWAAGGDLQARSAAAQIQSFQDYFSGVLHLGKNQYTLQPLKPGAIVVGGTILGRLGAGTPSLASHLKFMIRPAGKKAPLIDPKPILDGWKLLEATAEYRAAGDNPFFGPHAKSPTIGQILLMSKQQLAMRVLEDPHVHIYACGRRDIQAGAIDRRIEAVIEFLSASGLDPTVSGLKCGASLTGSNGVDAAGASGASVDISKIDNTPVQGNQRPGSVIDIALRRLLTLQGIFKPDEIVSKMTYKNQPNTLSLPDHGNRIQVTYTPLFGANKKLSAELGADLKPSQWLRLIGHLNQLQEPVVPIEPSQFAIKVGGSG